VATSDFFLFVSHVAENRSSAMEIVGELERRGTRCWIAPRDIRPIETVRPLAVLRSNFAYKQGIKFQREDGVV
jgi:hypothetical protein